MQNTKRKLIKTGVLGSIAIATGGVLTKAFSKNSAASTQPSSDLSAIQLDKNPDEIIPFELSEAQWRERLDDKQFHVLRKEGTERAFTSPLNDEKRDGEYVCAGCGLLLFTSSTKYDSGTGWPSFYDGELKNIGTSVDYKLLYPRTEYHCKRCGGHQGHVFKDGPRPTGLRYCNNGVALRFIPA